MGPRLMADDFNGSLGGLGDDDEIVKPYQEPGRTPEPGMRQFAPQQQPDAFTPSTTMAARKPMPIAAKGMPKLTRIIIDEVDNMPPTGQPFGFNGRTFIIRPGEEVDVPDGIINVLNDAVVMKPMVDPVSKKVIGYRQTLRIPYRVISR